MPGVWHNKWENFFPEEKREIKFCFATINETCNRRADVILHNNRSLEIQHSLISNEDIMKRMNDWGKFGKEIIWIIDGNTQDVILEKLSTGNNLITFNNTWKYKSFSNHYDTILLDIDDKIFKINPKMVKSKMYLVSEYKTQLEVVDKLNNDPLNIWSLWNNDSAPHQCALTIHQKGAGNGKTYGIWKSILENVDSETFIIVTKQHSAKNVIYEELHDQEKRNIFHIENITDKSEENTGKHYVIKYTHKITKRKIIIIIATIDSLCYNLSSASKNARDIFQSILENIYNNGASKMSCNGHIVFAGQDIYLNKKTELWIDETQDLDISYLRAVYKIILDSHISVNCVGDTLQSLDSPDNFFTSVLREGLPEIELIVQPYENINRRIKVKNMANAINKIIKDAFDKYELPPITVVSEDELLDQGPESMVFQIIESPSVYAGDTDTIKICEYVDKIIGLVRDEVYRYFYLPENFMFIFPILKMNMIATELETKLQAFWIHTFHDETYLKNIKDSSWWNKVDHTDYIQYVVFHKSEDGCSINTQDSIHASRIISIKTAKGDGREVVFCLNFTEQALKLVSGGEIGMVYESHLHVGLTRSKNKVYFGLVPNKDDIHKRFKDFTSVSYCPTIRKMVGLNKIKRYIDNDIIIQILNRNGITEEEKEEEKEKEETREREKDLILQTEIIDWGHHCVRYAVFYYAIIFCIIKKYDNDTDFNKSQIKTILSKISKYDILEKSPKDYYGFLHNNQVDELPYFPICNLSHKEIYSKYNKEIINKMKTIQKKIREQNYTPELTPYEFTILLHMLQLEKNRLYVDTTITDIYNITNIFKNKSKEFDFYIKIKPIQDTITRLITNIEDDYGKFKWNIEHTISFRGKTTDDFALRRLNYPIIGHNDSYVIHFVLKTNFNSINYWDTLIEILLERFIIYNPAVSAKTKTKTNNNIVRYDDKKIITYVVILEKNEYKKFDWEWDNNDIVNIELREEIKKALIANYTANHTDLFNYLNSIIDNNNKENENKNKYYGEQTEFTTPYQYLVKKFTDDNFPNYIIRFFEELHENYMLGRKREVKSVRENMDIFCDKLECKLAITCDSYLGIKPAKAMVDDF